MNVDQVLGIVGSIGIIAFILFLAFLPVIRYKAKATRLGVKISWPQVLGLSIRKTMKGTLLEAAAIVEMEKLPIRIADLEIHLMAGGDPLKVVTTIIDYKRKGKTLDFKLATAFDLGGKDFEKAWGDDIEKPH